MINYYPKSAQLSFSKIATSNTLKTILTIFLIATINISFAQSSSQTYQSKISNPSTTGNPIQPPKPPSPYKTPSRYWINLQSPYGYYNQMLVGYIKEATTELDWGYDGQVFGGSSFLLYTMCEGVDLSIQALPLPFDNDTYLTLGFKTPVAGPLTITLSNFDGVFATSQSIYIKDNFLGQYHNLKNGPYQFSSAAGKIDDRFELHYLPDGDVLKFMQEEAKVMKLVVYKQYDNITVISQSEEISEVVLYDLAGKVLKVVKNIGATNVVIDNLAETNQIVILKITTADGMVTTKKLQV